MKEEKIKEEEELEEDAEEVEETEEIVKDQEEKTEDEKIQGETERKEEREDELREQLEALKEKLSEAEEEKEDYRDRLLRLQADLENFKKRQRKKKREQLRKEREDIIRDFIPIYDNLTRAINNYEENEDKDTFIEGIEKIYTQFSELLNKKDIEPMEAAGEKFDPSKHEALMKVESDEYDDNEIVEEFERGYSYGDRVLKPSKVKVNVKPSPNGGKEEQKAENEE